MSAVAISAGAVDISRLLEPKGSSYPSRSSISPSAGAKHHSTSTERSIPSSSHLPPAPAYPEFHSAEQPLPPPPPPPPPPGLQPGYAAAGIPPSSHDSQYPQHGIIPPHGHPGYAPAASAVPLPYDSAAGIKRPRSQDAHLLEPPAKKQSKWTAEENELIIKLRGDGMKWDDVSKHLPGRSAISCRLHYQNFLERRPDWDEEKKNKLARLYERFRREMWERVAKELKMPWRAAEDMHWQLGRNELAQRAGVQPFHAAAEGTATLPVAGVPITTSFVPTTAYPPPAYSTSPQSYQGSAYPPGHNQHTQPVYTYPPPTQHPPYQHSSYSHPAPPPHHHQPPSSVAPPGAYPDSGQQPKTYRQPTPSRESASHSRRSDNFTATSGPGGVRSARLSPGSSSPRRRALSASRIAANSIQALDPRARTPPATTSLPPLPRDYYPGSPPVQGQQLPPVRFLTDESAEERRTHHPRDSAAPSLHSHDVSRE